MAKNKILNNCIDIKRFLNARESALDVHKRFNIGTYKERSVHLILKLYIEPDFAFHEVKIGRYIADICIDNEIVEIQTSAFSKLKSKIEHFVNEGYYVDIVYPIIEFQRGCLDKSRKWRSKRRAL